MCPAFSPRGDGAQRMSSKPASSSRRFAPAAEGMATCRGASVIALHRAPSQRACPLSITGSPSTVHPPGLSSVWMRARVAAGSGMCSRTLTMTTAS